LIRQITELETQLDRRRQSLRLQVTGIRHKVTGQLITPGVLLAAVGFGVTLERSQHLNFRSVTALFDTVRTSLGLLEVLKSFDPALH